MTSDAQKAHEKNRLKILLLVLLMHTKKNQIRDIITRSTQIEVEKIDRRKLASYLRTVAEEDKKKTLR